MISGYDYDYDYDYERHIAGVMLVGKPLRGGTNSMRHIGSLASRIG